MAEDNTNRSPHEWIAGDSVSDAEIKRRMTVKDSVLVPAMLTTARTQLHQCAYGKRSPKDILNVALQLLTALDEILDRVETPEVFYTVDEGYITAVDTRQIHGAIRRGLEYPLTIQHTTES